MKKRLTLPALALRQTVYCLLVALALCGCGHKPAHEEPIVSRGHLTTYADFASQHVAARTIRVWTPSGYSPDSTYDVLYMHDGQMLFDADYSWNHQEWGVDEVADSLIQCGLIRPCIVVGIDNGANRIGEYCPDDAADCLPDGGALYKSAAPMGNQYLRFVTEELKPFIDSLYPTRADAEHTFMIGSSCGGLISSYALCRCPQVFGGVACLSTNCAFMEPGRLRVNREAAAAYTHYLAMHLPEANSRLLYMDCGDRTLDSKYTDLMPVICDSIRSHGWDDDHFRYRFAPGAAHTETDWQSRLPEVMEFLLGE